MVFLLYTKFLGGISIKGIKITNNDINKFCELYEEGLSPSEISRQLNFEYKTITTYLKQRGYKITKIHGCIAKEIIDRYKSGATMQELSNIYGYKIDTISRFLINNNVELRKYKFNKKDVESMKNDYFNNGMSLDDLSEKYNSNRNTIAETFERYGIDRKSPSIAARKYSLNEKYFDEIDTQNKAYILGFFYADGYVSSLDSTIAIDLQERDKYILEEMKKEFESDRPLYLNCTNKKKNDNCQNVWCLSLNSQHMHDSLCEYGVVPNKTFIINYPDFLRSDLHRHFIRGVMDGDGTVSKVKENERHFSVSICGTKALCDGLKNTIEKEVDVRCGVYKRGNIYVMAIGGSLQSYKFLSWIYQDSEMKLIRKYQHYLDFCKKKNLLIAA